MIMDKKDLDNTKPIEVLSDIETLDIEESREDRYKDAVLKEEKKEQAELAEEALAEKNIAEAEKLLNADKETKKKKDKKENKDKVHVGVLVKNKWKSLSKKQQIIAYIVAGILAFALLVLIIFLLIGGKDEEEVLESGNEEVVDTPPVVVDNFYYKDGVLYFLNDSEAEIGSYECSNKDSNLCYVPVNHYQDDFDVATLVSDVGKFKEQRIPIYEENYVFLYDNKNQEDGEYILYSIKDKKEVERYLDVKAYDENLVVIQNKDKKYGLIKIDKGVVEVVKPAYKDLGMINGQEYLVALNGSKYSIIDRNGKVLSSEFDSNYKIKNYNKHLVVALVGRDYNVFDYKGNVVASGYDFATIKDSYAILVDKTKLFIIDKNKDKYNEGGIKLNNTNYVKSYVYDETGKLLETRRSFEVSIKNGLFEVAVYGDENEPTHEYINILQGNINKNYDYVNYFDGKLYFYEDKEKEEVLGYYSCSSKNNVSKDTKEYDSCIIATDDIFSDNDMVSEKTRNSRIPIINGKYAFVKDGESNVVLFDIEDMRTLSSYSKVDTNTASNDLKVTEYNGKLNVLVLNKKGKYGMIVIDGKSVNTGYAFEYNKLEKLGMYHLALDSSNSWRILYGGSESVGFTNKVRGYNSNNKYFKVMEDNQYYVYDDFGNKIIPDSYAYVELYGTYYAALNSNRELSIYDYTGNKLSKNIVTIGNYELYGTSTPAFKVKQDGEDYVVSVWDGKQYNDTVLSTKEETGSGNNPEGGEEESTETPES